ncbi:F0F1 ATP synthase subunit epsilon [Zobellella denitrificans]|jgi:F-type H+-transporting ATPase subunit epsilon|uniref:ATP synthase epsilon chain n=1 Tax=Zobellella denitrificans TaxID=347534 RepID=A0A231N173_9GAMM|nr:F0F1 ATP synthase subunit epsilon [Zobellella denitrificans]ATG75673.1 ATP synthase F0F1 subunit epsilon [Zobellella denitrificans]OXS16069.1 F0F1 ATP synthase subunit epsilon [Zobellella denitrificans]
MADYSFHLDIVSAEERLYSGSVTAVTVSGSEGELGIRYGHAPLLTSIRPGLVQYLTKAGKQEVLYVSGGMLEVLGSSVMVLADTAIRAEDLDKAKAEEAKRAAEAKLHGSSHDTDYAEAAAELARAMAKLRVLQLLKQNVR